MVRAEGLVHGAGRGGRRLLRRDVQRPVHGQGFKEPIIGYISIVETAREGALLTQNQRLSNRIYALRRAGKKQDKAFTELEGQFDALDRVRSSMASRDECHRGSARRRRRGGEHHAGGRPRPLLAPSTGIALVLALFALSALIVGRKQRNASVPALRATRQEERRREQQQDQRDPMRRVGGAAFACDDLSFDAEVVRTAAKSGSLGRWIASGRGTAGDGVPSVQGCRALAATCTPTGVGSPSGDSSAPWWPSQ